MFDTIIIGGGPSGLTAAIYAARRMMKTLLIAKQLGGQAVWASEIQNYPGVPTVRGPELISRMAEQVKNSGVEIKIAEVTKIEKQSDGSFSVSAGTQNYAAKTIIITMGLEPKSLKLANEKELVGKGISYCANCDGPFFKGKIVAVVGGGNAALDAAEVMSKIAQKVYLIYHKPQFKGFEALVAKVKERPNISIMLQHEIEGVNGQARLEKITVKDMDTQTENQLDVDGLFIEIGHEPKTDLLADLVKRDAKGQVLADSNGLTDCPGVFAAGDVTAHEFKQIIIASGQAAVAALSAYKYLQGKK